jgi:hypothetical protein
VWLERNIDRVKERGDFLKRKRIERGKGNRKEIRWS